MRIFFWSILILTGNAPWSAIDGDFPQRKIPMRVGVRAVMLQDLLDHGRVSLRLCRCLNDREQIVFPMVVKQIAGDHS